MEKEKAAMKKRKKAGGVGNLIKINKSSMTIINNISFS